MNKITGLAAVAAVLAFTVSSAHAATIDVTPRPSGGSYLYITGDIDLGDDQKLASLQPQYLVYVRPNSRGGAAYVKIDIADSVWQRQYNTVVTKADALLAGCSSACTWIWLSGYHDIAFGARPFLHSMPYAGRGWRR